MPTVLIAPDKFKGTLTARAAVNAIARGWRRRRPGDSLICLPVSDGGDGFGDVLGDLLAARTLTVRTLDAAHRRRRATWWWEPKSRTAIIESANIIGLAILPPGKFHPFDLDTFGLGTAIRAAAARKAKRCIIGIGGSATNDGGFGLARALGWKFLDRSGHPIERWTALDQLAEIRPPQRRLRFPQLIIAVDVTNPLLGLHGATRTYGPQKGLRHAELKIAERCLARLARVFQRQFRLNPAIVRGSGAAGGLGFGLQAFCDGKIVRGFEMIAREAHLDRQLRRVDLVITGEGRIDATTFMGKAAGDIARKCRQRKIPCLAFAGTIDRAVIPAKMFEKTFALTDLTTSARARAKAGYWLTRLAEKAAALERGASLRRPPTRR